MKITIKLLKQIIKEHKTKKFIGALYAVVKTGITGINNIPYELLSASVWLKTQYQIMGVNPPKWYSLKQGSLLSQAIWAIVMQLKYCPNCGSNKFGKNHLYSKLYKWHCWDCTK